MDNFLCTAITLCCIAQLAHDDGSACPIGWVSWPLESSSDEAVTEMIEFDDGGGLSLYVGGPFRRIGGQIIRGIARWDGVNWHPLGGGLAAPAGSSSAVWALEEFQSELIAGGQFTIADEQVVNYVAAWNGAHWRGLGTGLTGTSQFPGIDAMCQFDGKLIVSGRFDAAGGVAANHVAAWTGTEWEPLGLGVDGDVGAMIEYQGKLIVGGFFSHAGGMPANCIAMWDGAKWHSLGSGVGSRVTCLGVHNGDLIVGGQFLTAGEFPANRIAKWDGAIWTSMGLGMTNSRPFCGVYALHTHGGELFAGGFFGNAGEVSANNIAAWNGSTWRALGAGVGIPNSDLQGVGLIAPYLGDLLIGGRFTVAGGQPAAHLAIWGNLGPAFVEAPEDVSVCPGNQAVLSVGATGTGAIGFQWYKDGDALADDGRITGTLSPLLLIGSIDLVDDGEYTVMATDNCRSTLSTPVHLTVPCCRDRPLGDLNQDGTLNALDIQFFVNALTSEAQTAEVVCEADYDYDRAIGYGDIQPFIQRLLN